MRFVLSLLIFLLPVTTGASAYGGEATNNYLRISALLFPETVSWSAVDSMKRVEKGWLEANHSKLEQAYIVEMTNKIREDGGCSFITGLLSNESADTAARFFLHDVDADGRMDVLYSGPAPCSEGNASIVWFATASGFEVRFEYVWSWPLFLSIKEGSKLQASSVTVGCCSNPVDVYELGDSADLDSGGKVSITKPTELPQRAIARKTFKTNGEMVLRESPRIDDTYDEGFSLTMNFAVFGNVLSRYLPGCSGVVVGDSPDTAPGWSFVVLDKDCGPLRTHVADDVNAGWVESGQLGIGKE